MCLTETEIMVYKLVLTIFIQKWLNFENLLLLVVENLGGFSWFHNNSAILKDKNYKIYP